MLAKFENHGEAISLRLSAELTRDLDTGFSDLSRARTKFQELAKLTRTSQGYLRSTEITRVGARWNVHDHLVVIALDNRRAEAGRLLDLWDEACRQIGLQASSHDRGDSDTPGAIEYILKPRLGRGEGSLQDLLHRAADGDADAADDWIEWDAWRKHNPGARFRYSWISPGKTPSAEPRTPRNQSNTTVPDADLNRMALLIALGATTNAQHIAMLGVSRRSVQRRREQIPEAPTGAIPFKRTC